MHHFFLLRLAVMISTTILPNLVLRITWKHSTHHGFSWSEKKKWHFGSKYVTWCESQCHLPHLSPSYNPAHERSLLVKISASRSRYSFIHLWYHQSSLEPAVILFKHQLHYWVMNKICECISSGLFFVLNRNDVNPKNGNCRLFWM